MVRRIARRAILIILGYALPFEAGDKFLKRLWLRRVNEAFLFRVLGKRLNRPMGGADRARTPTTDGACRRI